MNIDLKKYITRLTKFKHEEVGCISNKVLSPDLGGGGGGGGGS